MTSKTLTVITVCYNAENTIVDTLKSLLSQSTNDFEYLVIDGKSTDNTVEIINEYKKFFLHKGIEVHVLSEVDEGIYDAMNKGILLAKTEWIQFCNSGTTYCDSDVLAEVITELRSKKSCDVVFGDYISVSRNKTRKVITDIHNITQTMSLGHESCFFKRVNHKKFKYNTVLDISADYNTLLRMYLKKCKFEHINKCILYFYENGFSCQNKVESARQVQMVRYINGIIPRTKLNKILIKTGLIVWKEIVYYEILPMWITNMWSK